MNITLLLTVIFSFWFRSVISMISSWKDVQDVLRSNWTLTVVKEHDCWWNRTKSFKGIEFRGNHRIESLLKRVLTTRLSLSTINRSHDTDVKVLFRNSRLLKYFDETVWLMHVHLLETNKQTKHKSCQAANILSKYLLRGALVKLNLYVQFFIYQQNLFDVETRSATSWQGNLICCSSNADKEL